MAMLVASGIKAKDEIPRMTVSMDDVGSACRPLSAFRRAATAGSLCRHGTDALAFSSVKVHYCGLMHSGASLLQACLGGIDPNAGSP